MPSFYPFSDLTGGGAGALDALDGAGLANGDIAFVAIEDNALYDDVALIYVLDADSAAAEAVPDVIAPDANGGNKRWLLACLVSKDLVLRGTLNVTGVATFGANPRIYDGDSHHASIDVPDIGADITITLPGVTATLATTTELHAAATLEAGLNTNLLSLSGQELQLDVQGANEVFAGPTTGVDATPSFRALVADDFPTLNQNTTGSAASLSVSGQSGKVTVTGLASTDRAKTVRDADDTILELGGSYTPTGTWSLASATITNPPTWNQNTTGISGGVVVNKTLTATALNDFTIGKVGYLAAAGTVTLTDADAEAESKGLLFIATATINADASGVFLREGEITLTGHGFTVGDPLFLSTDVGDLTNTAPSVNPDVVRRVGYALDANTVLFQPSMDYTVVPA